jgi:uncharacterized membrane protein YfcA
MITVESVSIVILVFLLAGMVKGVIGFGLPTVSVSLLAATVGLTEAMVLMLLPSFATNVWQAVVGGHLLRLLRRLWTMIFFGAAFVWVTSSVLTKEHLPLLTILLGIVICLYALSNLMRLKLPSPGRQQEQWMSPSIGLLSGALTGVTGVFVVPAVAYLQALRWSRDQLIQAMGIWFTVATVSLAGALSHHGLLTHSAGLLSGAAIVPALVGMAIGQRLRRRLSPGVFRTLFHIGLAVLGGYLIIVTQMG